MFWAGVAFLLGDFLFQQSSQLPSVYWLASLPVLGLILRRLFPETLLPLWFLFGWGWGLLFAHYFLYEPLPEACLHTKLEATGVIRGIPHSEDEKSWFKLELNNLNASGCQVDFATIPVMAGWYRTKMFPQAGEVWVFTLKLKETRNYYNEAGFDYEAFMLGRGVRYRATVIDGALKKYTAPMTSTLRAKLAQRINLLAGERPGAGVIRALVIGDRGGLTQEQKKILLHSGTLHLMAISGLHIGMVSGFGYFLVAGLWRLWPRVLLYIPASLAASFAAIVVACIYAFLAGFTLPTQRALIMLVVVMLGYLFRRAVDPASVLGVAVILVLLRDPFSVNLPGFWLSFAAVALLLFTFTRNRRLGFLLRWTKTQGVLSLGLLPLSLLFFQGVSLVGPVANFLAINWVGIMVLPAALTGVVLDLAGLPLAERVIAFSATSIEWLLLILGGLSRLPMSWAILVVPGWLALLSACLGLFMILAPSFGISRRLFFVMLLPLFLTREAAPEEGAFWLDMLDVGEGLSIVVRTQNHVLVYDTGPQFESGFNTGTAVILPWLRQQGVKKLDVLMISHGDNDHIGGAHDLMDGIAVSRVITSVTGRFEAAEACLEGMRWTWDQVRFEILHPPVPWSFKGNNGSCVLRISNTSRSVLLTGDIESMAEFRLRKEYPKLQADILVVPHHGSKTSSTQAFLEQVRPELALVSTGYRNRFGFPRPEISGRYANLGIPLHDTARSGTLGLRFSASEAKEPVERYLDGHLRYWYSATD